MNTQRTSWLGRFVYKLDTIGLGDQALNFLENLSILIQSGLTPVEAVSALKADKHSRQMEKIIGEIERMLLEGMSLTKAFRTTGLFKEYVLSLLEVGESSGRLDENLMMVSETGKRNKAFRTQLRSALMYPVLVVVLTVLVGLGVAWFILPRLALVFERLNVELPFMTQLLINLGTFLGEWGHIVVPSTLAFLLFILLVLFVFPKTKRAGHWLILRMPFIKRLVRELEISRMGYVIGSTIGSGISIVEALTAASDTAGIYAYKRFFAFLKYRIEEGDSFRKAFETYPYTSNLIPVSLQQLIIAGERSGRLSNVFIDIGSSYETKIKTTTKNLTVILEPILLVIIWGGVMGVALGVIVPIYSLLSGVNRSPAQQPAEQATSEADIIYEADRGDDIDQNVVVPEEREEEVVEEETQRLRIVEGIEFLNIRTQPSSDAPSIGEAYPGETYTYDAVVDEWHSIQLQNAVTGWVFSEYVEELSE